MTQICWWLVDLVCRTFEPAERTAVRGDIAESGETATCALYDVAGLFVRRQAALWADWKLWLTFVGLVVPFGWILSGVATWVADGSAIPIWMYANNWTWTYVTNQAFRLDLIHHSFTIAKQYLTLFCCSWTCGLMLGVLSRRAIPVIAAMFCLMLMVRGIFSARQLHGQGHEAVFSLVFYSVIFPLIVLTMLVLLPTLWGMRAGLALAHFPFHIQTIVWSSALLTLTAMVGQQWFRWPMRGPGWSLVLAFATPAVYLVAKTRRRQLS
ncbi:MAG TPA: hypothetical protein VEX68_23215 [Bryobacteraceae bacterium]|nr:hypothetical protein [Bryobacteraceae bacterium]